MKRREFLQCAALLSAGATMAPNIWAMTMEQKKFLAAQPSYIDRHPLTFFNAQQRATITAMAEQVIPTTDTPGAIDAGVPRFIELMVANWFNEAERKIFIEGLAAAEGRSDGPFAQMSSVDQLALLEVLEDESGDSSWYDTGNVLRIWDETAPFICQIKELTVLGFFLSEVGSSQVLRANPMGSFDGDIVLGPEDASYATPFPLRNMVGSQGL